MSTNQKTMYMILKQEVQRLQSVIKGDSPIPNEIPKDFNQTGWELTIASVENMLAKMKEAHEKRGKRLTPQFFRSIFNRTLLADVELNKFLDMVAQPEQDIDYAAECIKLNAQLYELNKQMGENNSPQSETTTETEESDSTDETDKTRSRRGAANVG